MAELTPAQKRAREDAQRKQDQDRADASANAQRQHDAAMAAQSQQHAINMQNMQNAENQKSRDFEKKQSARERASSYVTQNTKGPKDMSGDHTGGAAAAMQSKFGNGNSYQGKGFQQFDFSKMN